MRHRDGRKKVAKNNKIVLSMREWERELFAIAIIIKINEASLNISHTHGPFSRRILWWEGLMWVRGNEGI